MRCKIGRLVSSLYAIAVVMFLFGWPWGVGVLDLRPTHYCYHLGPAYCFKYNVFNWAWLNSHVAWAFWGDYSNVHWIKWTDCEWGINTLQFWMFSAGLGWLIKRNLD